MQSSNYCTVLRLGFCISRILLGFVWHALSGFVWHTFSLVLYGTYSLRFCMVCILSWHAFSQVLHGTHSLGFCMVHILSGFVCRAFSRVLYDAHSRQVMSGNQKTNIVVFFWGGGGLCVSPAWHSISMSKEIQWFACITGQPVGESSELTPWACA